MVIRLYLQIRRSASGFERREDQGSGASGPKGRDTSRNFVPGEQRSTKITAVQEDFTVTFSTNNDLTVDGEHLCWYLHLSFCLRTKWGRGAWGQRPWKQRNRGQDLILDDSGQDLILDDSGQDFILDDSGQDLILHDSGQDAILDESCQELILHDNGQHIPG